MLFDVIGTIRQLFWHVCQVPLSLATRSWDEIDGTFDSFMRVLPQNTTKTRLYTHTHAYTHTHMLVQSESNKNMHTHMHIYTHAHAERE